jgi:hypothetical protein
MNEQTDPSSPSPEVDAQIRAEREKLRVLNVSEIQIVEKVRFWLGELHLITGPRGYHHLRPKCANLRQQITALLKNLREFEEGKSCES